MNVARALTIAAPIEPWTLAEKVVGWDICEPETGRRVARLDMPHRQDEQAQAGLEARLIAAAPAHALAGWAMCVQDASWEEWGADGRGEFCFAGFRYATRLDEFGCPVLPQPLLDRIAQARREWANGR